ncbi:MerR family transcriptional regulator [Planotetraspora thailandica]|uniref:MerR family transcriptional regulator n=1 Tax=Planotetraspora thailandica TaxID=487172 RepID=A0A8J3UWJ3_9ACTN|nr:MerR family transcriptional regulator [Planotetraspora thailandica]GII52136.1 MerR family transcriptional regulator [Planotetraspora thailandica]
MTAQLTIGEFSVMSQLSKKALRHYHELGLLEPAHVDAFNGYRLYDTSQLRTAQIIRRFRALGVSVPDIRAIMATDDVDRRNQIIGAHLRRMEEQLSETREAVGALRELLEPGGRPVDVEFRSVSATRVWAITETVAIPAFGDWYREAMREIRSALSAGHGTTSGPPGGLYAPELFGDEIGEATVFIPSSATSGATGRVRVVEIPPAELAVAVHHGSHADVDRTYGALGGYVAERLLGVEGPIRENYLVTGDGPFAEQSTEICWPIFRTATR